MDLGFVPRTGRVSGRPSTRGSVRRARSRASGPGRRRACRIRIRAAAGPVGAAGVEEGIRTVGAVGTAVEAGTATERIDPAHTAGVAMPAAA